MNWAWNDMQYDSYAEWRNADALKRVVSMAADDIWIGGDVPVIDSFDQAEEELMDPSVFVDAVDDD